MVPDKSSSRQSGFTLVEILVSTGVLAIIVGLLAQVLSSAQLGLGNLQNSAKRRQDAATVLSNMAKDLRATLHPLNANYEGADPLAGQFQLLINPPGVPTSSGVCNPNTIFWNASSGNSSGGTGLLGYVVRWGVTESGKPQPLLCRMCLTTAQTMPQLTLIQTMGASPFQWPTPSLIGTYAPADINNGYQGWLADNVLALYVRALDPGMLPISKFARTVSGVSSRQFNSASASGVDLNQNTVGTACGIQYDSRQGYQYANSTGTTIDRFGPVMPAAIELVIVAAEPRDIAQLSAPVYASTTYDSTQDMWTNVNNYVAALPSPLKKNTRVYSTIVTP